MTEYFKSTPEKQQACNHPTLTFGSGDYYVMCRECSRTWVKVGMASDEADPEFINDTITGEARVELTLANLKVAVEGE
jgi:hypothetical protein